MARYHVSGDGKPRKCTAASPESCPCAQKDENGKVLNHFDSEAEADRYGEKIAADGAKNAGSLSKNPLDVMAKHAPDDALDDPATRAALGALAMRGCTLEKQEDGRYKITGADNAVMSGLVSNRGTFVDGAEVNDDGSVSIGITMNGSIPHWGAESFHGGGGDVSLEAHSDLLLRKNDDGEYVLTTDNDDDIASRISFDPRETLEDFKYGANDIDDIDEDDDDRWLDANDEAIRENLSEMSDVDCDLFFGEGTSMWIQEDGAGAVDNRELEAAREVAAKAREVETRKRVAEDPSTPASVLAKLSDDPDENIRRSAANNPNTPASVLDKLSADSDANIRGAVADNPNAPADSLARMSDDPYRSIRHHVARNPNTSVDVLTKLSTDSDEGVRSIVAKNSNTPADTLARMSEDPARAVRIEAAGNPNMPVDVLTKLSTDSDEYIRRSVARNLSTTADSLIKLSAESDHSIRNEVSGNPNTPLNVLTKLAHDEIPYIRRKALERLEVRRQKND